MLDKPTPSTPDPRDLLIGAALWAAFVAAEDGTPQEHTTRDAWRLWRELQTPETVQHAQRWGRIIYHTQQGNIDLALT